MRMATTRKCRNCGESGHNSQTCGNTPTPKPPRKRAEWRFCVGCESTHRHSGGAIFCSRLAARVNPDDRVPSSCIESNRYKKRTSPMRKASIKPGDGSELEKEMKKW